VPVDGDPRRLAVSFTFDSSVPCRRARPALRSPLQTHAPKQDKSCSSSG